MKSSLQQFLIVGTIAAITTCINAVEAAPVPDIVSGSTAIGPAPGVAGKISFAVISGADFLAHGFPFSGAVPPGSLDALGVAGVHLSDFVYLYQNVNTGDKLIDSFEVAIGGAGATFTGGGRLESTIFVDPGIGKVTLGPLGATSGLSGGPLVDFSTFDPTPCLGSGGGNNCSDGATDLLPSSVKMHGFDETPSTTGIDPRWSSSIMWFSTPLAPGKVVATEHFSGGPDAIGLVAGPVPEPQVWALLAGGLALLGFAIRRKTM